MKKPRILVVGSTNMDFVCAVDKVPEAGETVWDIAKHYRIPPALLCEANRLDIRTEFPDTKGLPLVIPKHPIFAKMKA